MNSVQRSNPNFKPGSRGRGHQSVGRGQSQGGISSTSSDGHQRNRDPYYNSSSHSGTSPQQHSSYSYETNWRAHNSNSRNYPRAGQTPPTPESPSQTSFTEDETVKFLADAWQEVENERKNPKDGFSAPVMYQEKAPIKNRPDFEPFDLESWHDKRVHRV